MSSQAHPDMHLSSRVEVDDHVDDQATADTADTGGAPDQATRDLPRGMIFVVLALACVVVAGGYVTWAVLRDGERGEPSMSGPIGTGSNLATLSLVAGGAGTLLFQNMVSGDYRGRIGLVPLGGPEWPRSMLPLACQRFHFAADRGLCLAEDGGTFSTEEGLFVTHAAYIVGPDFRLLNTLPLSGFPSRARISPDGRYGATTVFVSGHSYAEVGFSTETTLIDLVSGDKIATLEEFAVTRDGQRFESVDFNFWGVTFAADSDRFFATLATQGKTYLVEGQIGARQARVLRDNVECPSLSPDGTRLAFKKRVGGGLGGVTWRFHVLDLATMTETPLAETRSVDDQIEWLDDQLVLYGSDNDIWTMPADGGGQPERLVSNATSPTVVRSASPPPPDAQATPVDMLSLPATDLTVAVAGPPAPVRVGEVVAYTVTVTNRGPLDATELRVGFALPDGMVGGGASSVQLAGGSWGCSVQDAGKWVTCDAPGLPSGESWTIQMTAMASTAGTMTSRFTVGANEPDSDPGTNTASVGTDVVGDL